MSNNPLPVHISCLGVHQDAVSSVRYSGKQSPTWGQRLAQVQKSQNISLVVGEQKASAASNSIANTSSAAEPQRGRYHACRLSAQTIGAPVSQQVYQQLTSQQAGKGGTLPVHPTGGSTKHIDSSKLVNSALFAAEPSLITVDFHAIADSSTGGAYGGLPRPYGRFQAHRAGDGLAQFERTPPPRVQQWHTKLAGGEDLTVTGTTSSPIHKSQDSPAISPPSRGGSPSKPGHSPSIPPPNGPCSLPSLSHTQGGPRGSPLSRSQNSRSPTRGGGQAGTAASLLWEPAPFTRPETTTTYRRASTGDMQAAPQQPHAHHSTWFHLPAATFLSRVPQALPHAGVRVDCGTSAAREFLKSGLHQPPPKAQHVPADTDAGSWAAEGAAQPLQPAVMGSPPPAERGVSPPGYRAVRVGAHEGAVYLPVDAHTDEMVLNSLGLQSTAHVAAVPPATTVLEAITQAHKLQPTTPAPPELSTAQRRTTTLPPEHSLARRMVPAVGR